MRGFDVITFDPARREKGIWRWEEEEGGGPFDESRMILSPEANDDERYMAERWPNLFGTTSSFPARMTTTGP